MIEVMEYEISAIEGRNSNVGKKYWEHGSKELKEVEEQVLFAQGNVRTVLGRFDLGVNKQHFSFPHVGMGPTDGKTQD